MEEIIKELGLKIDGFKDTTVSKEQLDTVTKELADLKAKGALVENLQEQINQLKENADFKAKVTETLKEVLETKKDELQALKNNRSGAV